jgi:hypothetical protein
VSGGQGGYITEMGQALGFFLSFKQCEPPNEVGGLHGQNMQVPRCAFCYDEK